MRGLILKWSGALVIATLPLLILRALTGGPAPAPIPVGSVPTFAGNAQHTAIYQPAALNLNTIRWSTSIDLNNTGAFAHYGAPVITAADTILVPVKTAGNGFRVDAFRNDGVAKYSLTTDYVLPNHTWIPVYNPCITTIGATTRLYYAGVGGTVWHIDNPDSASHGAPVREVFYTTLSNYLANASAYNATIFINTPLTADSQGNVFFGFRVQGTAPAPLSTTQSGFARIDPSGNGTYILAGAAANDPNARLDTHNSAPALSNDEKTLYVVAKAGDIASPYLLGLDSATLAPKYRAALKDPRNGNPGSVTDNSTASPTVAPDNDVYFGINGNPVNGFRGFLLRFSADLTVEKVPGGFGWDYTPAIVPADMVPSYQGPSTYLIFCKYNNYASKDGDGINRVALLDPNTTQIDPHVSAAGLVEMREVLTLIGPRPDEAHYQPEFPYAVREWCINTAAVNPITKSIFVPNEDGRLYRWNVSTNSFADAVILNPGLGQPYVPTVIGPNGTVYTLNGGTLFAFGPVNGLGLTMTSSAPDVRTVVTGEAVTFTAIVKNPAGPAPTPTGSVTFTDVTYQDLTPITKVLASNVPLNANGQASVTTSNLEAGNGFLGNHAITATYNGDANFPSGSTTLVQKVHAAATTTNVSTAPNPSAPNQRITVTATVSGGGNSTPTGMVTFQEGTTILAQLPLDSGIASFTTTTLALGTHTIMAVYQSDTVFALSSGTTQHSVAIPSPTPTPTATPAATPTATPAPTATPTATATPNRAQAINLSTRMRVGLGDEAGIGGFIITGNSPKHVLIRAIGPSLTQASLPDPLRDPILELYYSGPTPFAVNNDWRDTQEAAIRATGLAPTNERESAIDAILTPGNYTAIVHGNDAGTGLGLVEVYDLDQTAGRLGNISTRALVGIGDDITIAGFILGGNNTVNRVIIRGLGPSLARSGLANALENPALELRNQNGDLLIANHDWEDNHAQAAQLVAEGLGLPDKLEAGIAAALPPGRYTALLTGQTGGGGIGLVEVYDLGP